MAIHGRGFPIEAHTGRPPMYVLPKPGKQTCRIAGIVDLERSYRRDPFKPHYGTPPAYVYPQPPFGFQRCIRVNIVALDEARWQHPGAYVPLVQPFSLWPNNAPLGVLPGEVIDDQILNGQIFSYTWPFHNFYASAPPTNANDATQGYSAGSIWVDRLGDQAYICINSKPFFALWKKMTT